jgi:TniQ
VNYWRRLPAPLPPAQQETLASWLHRLAAVHGLNTADLRHHLGISRRPPGAGEVPALACRLEAVTGYPPARLARALPELRVPAPDWQRLRHLAQRACPRCTARHQGGPVRRLFAHHEYLCTRHGYWIGPPDPTRDDTPPHLTGPEPELAAAQRRLRRAERRHGWAAVFDATAAATVICIELRFWAVPHPLWKRWEQRLDLLMPFRGRGTAWRRSMFMAVIFPEVAALAAIVAAPRWQALAASGAAADADRLLNTVNNALGCAGPPDRHDISGISGISGISDTVLLHMRHPAGAPPLQPAAAYPDTVHHGDGIPRLTDGRRTAEQITATRFDRDRRAPRIPSPGAPMPYAYRYRAAVPSNSQGKSDQIPGDPVRTTLRDEGHPKRS